MDRLVLHTPRGSFRALAATLVLLLLPAVVLAGAAVRLESTLLYIGTVAHLLGAALLVRSRHAWRPPASVIVIALYLIALGWLWFAAQEGADGFVRVGRGLFLFVAVALTVTHDMTRTGLEPRRRARILTKRLQTRARWPRNVEEFSRLSDVWALHTVVRDDPTLAFELVNDPRPDVQTAALVALQDRVGWRWEEAAVVLAAGRKTLTPEVRAMALRAVATADNIDVTQSLMEYLKDPNLLVRAEACEALLAGGERRWAVARNAVRTVLADPAFLTDGALPGAAGRLPVIAVCDLTGWAAEPAPLAERAVRTLLAHYETTLRAGTEPGLAAELGRQVTDNETPPVLRVELATLMRNMNLLPHDLLDRMTDADQPSPIRLIAVEVLLEADPNEASALDVLRGLGRQPNRETALAIARILQRYRNVNFGVPLRDLTPKAAGQVAQMVFRWASGKASVDDSWLGKDVPLDLIDPNAAAANDEDALGGLPVSNLPASVPGLNSARHMR